jgi:hypothetical protein
MTIQTAFRHIADVTAGQDEFDFKTGKVDAVFRSRRGVRRHKPSIRIVQQPNYLPPYQLIGRIIGYSSRLQNPRLGFSVKARGTVELAPHQKVVRPI